MKKTLLALSLLGLTGSAVATPFYVDTGVNWNGETTLTSDKVCDTCTSSKDEIAYLYQSVSTTNDTDGSGGLSAGDTIFTDGGLAVGDIINNQVTGFNPNEVFGIANNNGYGSDWLLTFSFTGLVGTVVEYTPGTSLELAYGAFGNFDLYYTTDGVTLQNFMDIQVTGAVTGSGGTLLSGVVDFSNVDALPVSTYNLFHSQGGTCNGLTGFYDIWLNCDGIANPLLEITFLADFNTNASTIVVTDNGAAGAILQGNHDGSAVFNVPEPSTLALFGGTLLLLGASARRRKA
ncbi:PEP-CTERM sorting domain-containing protein [Sedimenticola hydrogenitrophicus]|uniref:PEP-CTERM sorting domain-containing protein n=1 Tax=Sedimenticola hydrogenitrophicus TaxID=2967975 RepID=UPI0021A4BCDC|nr:PEP-CTERM sorting domain-containing protein [Sedimenticola hydrogenitrophicus]